MHFDSFVPAMLTVFIILTGEWMDLCRGLELFVGRYTLS
jgi:hypothetical protein